jgi:2-aminoadipate transaminase
VDRRVERLQRQCVTEPGNLSLAGGLPAAETFPVAELAHALGQAQGNDLQYDWPEGRARLREWIAGRLAQRGAHVTPDDVLITSGAQQALDIAMRVVAPNGARVRVPGGCYPGALDLFADYECEVVEAGDDVELEYVMPVVGNPAGLALAPAERARLLEARHLVIEDDAYAELRFDGRVGAPLLASAPSRVLHVGTLSKTLCPGLRIGWLVVPSRLREAVRRAKQRSDLQGNTLAQSIVERYLAREDYDARLATLREFYSKRAERLADCVRRLLPNCRFTPAEGGFSLWVESSEPWDDVELLRHAVVRGTSFDPGRDFRVAGARGPLAFRLAFSSLPQGDFEEAVRRLASAFEDTRANRPVATVA